MVDMKIERRLELIKRNVEELITEREMEGLLKSKVRPHGYWGFECSGPVHLGTGLVVGMKIKDLLDAGFDFTVFLADWHSWINNKFEGDMERIRLAGEYFKEVFFALGIRGPGLRFVWSSEIVDKASYWEKVIKIAKKVSLNRLLRTLPIMGRKETSRIEEAAWLVYPLMQAADIFDLQVDVACAGVDQRKVHVMAREVARHLGFEKPILLHTPLLPSLAAPVPRGLDEKIDTKMSKSKRGGAILVHDSPEEIKRKVFKGYCPPKSVDDNPFFYLLRYVIFQYFPGLKVERERKYGGDVYYATYGELERDYLKGSLHPADLKNAIALKLSEILEPVRKHFEGRAELIELIMSED